MYIFFVVLHVVACVGLILVVLMQSGKGGGLSGLTGGGSSGGEQLFGASAGISFVKKVTVGFVLVFLFTSLVLTLVASRRGLSSVTSQYPMAPMSGAAGQ
jgi:preprotein translocase subunit SecG